MTVVSQKSPLTGELKAELVENAYLHIRVRKPFGNVVKFAVDVACIDPTLSTLVPSGLAGLWLATFAAAALSLLGLYGLWNDASPFEPLWRALALLGLPTTIGLGVVLRARSIRQVMVRTRCAGLPLLTIPVLHSKRKEIDEFIALLRLYANEAETKRGLNAERLRSGEIKTLRRLAQERVIPAKTYEDAKLAILKS